MVNPATGWGLAGESFHVLDALGRFYGKPWFNLGDRDLATHLYRTERLRSGAILLRSPPKSRAFRAEIAHPADERRPRSHPRQARGHPALPFQEYFVRRRARGAVEQIDLRGIEDARPTIAVLDAITTSRAVILAPSNPFVSLGPIFELAGVRDARAPTVSAVAAISPIIGGKTVKGPADKMMRGLGHEVSPLGIARLYKDCAGLFILDHIDDRYIEPIRDLGMRAVVADTIMTTPAKAARLANVVLDALAL